MGRIHTSRRSHWQKPAAPQVSLLGLSCPGTSKILQWWNCGKWIIAVQVLQISRIIRQILHGNESSSILEFKFDYGIQIGKSSEADFTFRFDLIFHSWSFSSCFHVMLLSQLICYVIILPKSACRCIVPTQQETIFYEHTLTLSQDSLPSPTASLPAPRPW